MIAAGVAMVVFGAVLLAALVLAAQDRLLRRRTRQRVVITLKSGAAFNGLLHEIDGRTLVLRDAKVLASQSGIPVAVDGELLVARADIDYLQRP